MFKSKALRNNVAMIVLAHATLFAAPAIVQAKGWDSPVNFTQSIRSERGAISPIGLGSVYFKPEDACHIATTEWGWSPAQCKAMDAFTYTKGVGTMSVDKPKNDGWVSLDDFDGTETKDAIAGIEAEIRAASRAQGERLGKTIEFKGWRLYPAADKAKGAITYATNTVWDGEPQINIRVLRLDRYGYVRLETVPDTADLTDAEIKAYADKIVASYKPEPEKSYLAYQPNVDKVAAYGGVGLLAATLGVKYAKPAAVVGAGILAALGKKAGLLLILPFLALGAVFRWIKSLFRGK